MAYFGAYMKSTFPHMPKWRPRKPSLRSLDSSTNDYVAKHLCAPLLAFARAAIGEVRRGMPRDSAAKVIGHFPEEMRQRIDAGGVHVERKMQILAFADTCRQRPLKIKKTTKKGYARNVS